MKPKHFVLVLAGVLSILSLVKGQRVELPEQATQPQREITQADLDRVEQVELSLLAAHAANGKDADLSIHIPAPAFKSGNRGWDSDLTLFQVEQLSGITATEGVDQSWVSWLQTSLSGLILEPKTYDNDPAVMVAYGLMGNGNHYSDLHNTVERDRNLIVKANMAKGMDEETAEKAAPNQWQMLIGDRFNTKEKKDVFLDWCLKNSEYVLWTLSKEEALIYTKEMWAAYDSVNRPEWLAKEKAYYAELQQKGKVSEFTRSAPDGKVEGRKLVCFVYRRCLDGSTTPEEATAYMKKAIQFFERAAAKTARQ